MKNVADIYPLTPTQAGILYHTLASPANDIYFQQISCTVNGIVEVEKFKQAWDIVANRHPALRTIFLWEGVDEPLQIVRKTVTIPWEIIDWRGLISDEQPDRLFQLNQKYRERGFNLTKAPIIHMVLVQLSDDQFHFIWNFHHLLTDGWSTHQVLNEAFAVYEALLSGEQYILSPVRPFRDYINWLKQQDVNEAELYWREKLKDFKTPTPLQVDKPVLDAAIRHGEIELILGADETDSLQKIARQHHLTLNTIIQGAWSILLSRYSGESDVVFGATLSGRPADLQGVENMVGMLINTLPVRVKLDNESQLLPWLMQLQTQQLEMRRYEYSSLAHIQRLSNVGPGQQLFESILVFENYPHDTIGERSIQIENLHYHEQSNYPLALLVLPGEQLRLVFIYNQTRFDRETIERMLGHVKTILLAIVNDLEQKLKEIPLLEPNEYQQIVVKWNETDFSYEKPVWLHDQISNVAKEIPNKRAVVASDGSLTYAELDKFSNQLANHLIRLGANPGKPIGLYVDRSKTMLVGILGILKAGCAYVPLDPAYPKQRINFMLDDTQAPLVVTQPHLISQLGSVEQRCIILDNNCSEIIDEPFDTPSLMIEPSKLAYIIYTSGSTGKPKGVMVSHNNLFHSNAARRVFYKENIGSYLLLSSFSFDSSVAGIFWTLSSGGTLVLPKPGDEGDIDKLAELIASERVTHTLTLPSLYRLLLDYAPSGSLDTLRTVIVAGEVCPPELGVLHYSNVPTATLFNEYGPTEATVWSSAYRISRDDNHKNVPIGRPIANAELYVLDPQNRPVPMLVPGELVIGGPSVVSGYWNHPQLSNQRFKPNLFRDGLVFHTGDLVRWLPDGNLEFLGRNDKQIKIRGYRVELGEIEDVLRQNKALRDALVTFDEQRLIAYLISDAKENNHDELKNAVRRELAERLPDYMLPSIWIWLDEFPRLPNGKIDHKSLPEPELIEDNPEFEYIAPCTDTELKIQSVWSDLLGLKEISVQDEFFSLGGHSLLMMQLVSRLRQMFNLSIPLSAVMDVRTIAGQAERIDTLRWSQTEIESGLSKDQIRDTREEFEI